MVAPSGSPAYCQFRLGNITRILVSETNLETVDLVSLSCFVFFQPCFLASAALLVMLARRVLK